MLLLFVVIRVLGVLVKHHYLHPQRRVWYWYLEDEKDFRELPNAEIFLEVCLRVISEEFRMKGFHELFTTISRILRQPNNRFNYEPYLKYVYNRHPFIQMTSKPLSTASVHVTIPLKRSPAHEIQLDILHLNQHFFNINYQVLVDL